MWICAVGKVRTRLFRLSQSQGLVSCHQQKSWVPMGVVRVADSLLTVGRCVLPHPAFLSPRGVLSCPRAKLIAALVLFPSVLGILPTSVPARSHHLLGSCYRYLSLPAPEECALRTCSFFTSHIASLMSLFPHEAEFLESKVYRVPLCISSTQ